MYGVSTKQLRPTALTQSQAAQLHALEAQKRLTAWPYYSRVKFCAPRTPLPQDPGFSYDIPQGAVARAFSYAVGDTKTAGGFTTADGNATIADTNLTQRNQTTGGQNVLIHGIAIQIVAASMHLNDGESGPPRVRPLSYQLTAAIFNSVSVELSLNGDENKFRLGSIGLVPGAGGLTGGAPQLLDRTGLAGESENNLYANNGWATRGNFYKVPEGLIWRNQSNADSQLNVIFSNTRPIQLFSGGSPENAIANVVAVNDDGVATGVAGYEFPTELCFEAIVHMVGSVIGPRSRAA